VVGVLDAVVKGEVSKRKTAERLDTSRATTACQNSTSDATHSVQPSAAEDNNKTLSLFGFGLVTGTVDPPLYEVVLFPAMGLLALERLFATTETAPSEE